MVLLLLLPVLAGATGVAAVLFSLTLLCFCWCCNCCCLLSVPAYALMVACDDVAVLAPGEFIGASVEGAVCCACDSFDSVSVEGAVSCACD